MEEPADDSATKRSIKRLTVAVWILAIVGVFNFCVSLVGIVLVTSVLPHIAVSTTAAYVATPPPGDEHGISFNQLPIERQIRLASVVAVTRYQRAGDRNKSIISEILKQTAGTTFYYNLGDEYVRSSVAVGDRTHGDGEVILFVGSPAVMRLSVTYMNGRVPALGDMPLTAFRAMIERQSD
jgi:hypothetical protein